MLGGVIPRNSREAEDQTSSQGLSFLSLGPEKRALTANPRSTVDESGLATGAGTKDLPGLLSTSCWPVRSRLAFWGGTQEKDRLGAASMGKSGSRQPPAELMQELATAPAYFKPGRSRGRRIANSWHTGWSQTDSSQAQWACGALHMGGRGHSLPLALSPPASAPAALGLPFSLSSPSFDLDCLSTLPELPVHALIPTGACGCSHFPEHQSTRS